MLTELRNVPMRRPVTHATCYPLSTPDRGTLARPGEQTAGQRLKEYAPYRPALERLIAGALGVALSWAALAGSAASTDLLQQAIRIPASPSPLLTEDAQEAWHWLAKYNDYVQLQASIELAAGCEQCRTNREMLQDAWKTVASYYFDPTGRFSQAEWARQLLQTLQGAGGVLASREQAYLAIQGMMQASIEDRYSRFLPPSAFREALRQPNPAERQQLAAEYVGVGVVIGERCTGGGWAVELALPGSPAEEAGARRGDCICAINGHPLDGFTFREVAALLSGPRGTSIELSTVDSVGSRRRIYLERRELPQPPTRQADLTYPGGGMVRYIRVYYFGKETPGEVQRAVEEGERKEVLGYILDLRSNSGGSFDAAVAVSTFFLPREAPIASTVTVRFGGGVDGEWQVGHLDPGAFPSLPGTLTDRPVVVLTNASTASASEMLVGALADNGRAVIVGARTFGKGLVQDYFAEPDGSGLELTVAKYITPSGWDVDEIRGIEPGMVCLDHPRGPAGSLDECISVALRLIAGLLS